MSWRERLGSWISGKQPVVPVPQRAEAMRLSQLALMAAGRKKPGTHATWVMPEPPPGVLPSGLAFDDATMTTPINTAWAWAAGSVWAEGLGFMGYQYLAELTQRPEYRRPSEILAKEMTRKWIKITATGGEDRTKEIEKLNDALDRFHIRELFQQGAQNDGYFGRSHIYVDTGATDDPAELQLPLAMDKAKIAQGSDLEFRLIEPMWCYPGPYNASDPLKEHFYVPQRWYVMAKTVHVSRLLTFIGRPVPDILKPAYAFGGLSLSQIGKPYVDNWLRTRQSVSDLVANFSQNVLATDLGAILSGGQTDAGADLATRIELFNRLRNNSGTMAIDKESEDVKNVAVPLGSLDKLQAQAQEHMAAVFGIPLVVLLGITPSGLNASSDGEIRTFYSWIKAQQEQLFGDNLKKVLAILQLREFGAIDPSITATFEPLWELDEKSQAETDKIKAETDDIRIQGGVIDPPEARQRVATDPSTPYASLDVDKVIEPPAEEEAPGEGDEVANELRRDESDDASEARAAA